MQRKFIKQTDYSNWTVEQHADYLRTEKTYKRHFEALDAEKVEAFIQRYALKKKEWYDKKENYQTAYERYQTQFLNKADRYIDLILQKKLFNLQCKWRAGLINLPLIQLCDDFDYWEAHIRTCPFIPLITQKEIDICVLFLNEKIDWDDNPYRDFQPVKIDWNDNPSRFFPILWQNYEGFKFRVTFDESSDAERLINYMHGCNEPNYPHLYLFFDEHQKTKDFLHLPNLRGLKEREYFDASDIVDWERREAEMKENGTWEEQMMINEEHLWDNNDDDDDERSDFYRFKIVMWLNNELYVDEFIELAEDEQTKELFKQKEHFQKIDIDLSNQDELTNYFLFLKEIDEKIPIEAHENWRVALEQAVRKFQQVKIADLLPYAYDAYLIGFEEMDSSPATIAKRVANHRYVEDCEEYEAMIENRNYFLQGRKALDENQDFDYL